MRIARKQAAIQATRGRSGALVLEYVARGIGIAFAAGVQPGPLQALLLARVAATEAGERAYPTTRARITRGRSVEAIRSGGNGGCLRTGRLAENALPG